MSIFRKLEKEELGQLARIETSAFDTQGLLEKNEKVFLEDLERIHSTAENVHVFGLLREGQVVGGLQMIDFKMHLFSHLISVGGAALVCVDLLHKKEKVAKDLICGFIDYYRGQGVPMVALYPFRADFYRKMGFGYGTWIKQHKVKPAAFPGNGGKKNLVYLDSMDKKAIWDCYSRFAAKRNGLFEWPSNFCLFLRKDNRIVGYRDGERVLGYISFTYRRESVNERYMMLNEVVYENSEILNSLCSFIRSQADQFEWVLVTTQDEVLQFLFDDPGSSSHLRFFNGTYEQVSATALGVMYRVINLAGLFENLGEYNFNQQNLKLKITISDTLCPENSGSIIACFVNGKVNLVNENTYDVEIELDVADFSSMFMGAVTFSALVELGRVIISNVQYLDTVNRIFLTNQKPMCMTYF
jgi:predicted acetyltransferase